MVYREHQAANVVRRTVGRGVHERSNRLMAMPHGSAVARRAAMANIKLTRPSSWMPSNLQRCPLAVHDHASRFVTEGKQAIFLCVLSV
jgi:hypothetical protein